MSIIAQFYPNGEFTHGVSFFSKRRTRHEHLSDHAVSQPDACVRRDEYLSLAKEIEQDNVPVGTEFISAQGYKYTYLRRHFERYFYAVEPPDDLPVYVTELEHHPRRWSYLVGASPLGSSNAPNFTQAPKVRKNKASSLTRSMARTLRNGVYLLEHQYGKGNLAFLTLTLPDLPKEGLEACCASWGKMVDQFLKWLRARIERQGGVFEYVYCTEVQTKRLTKKGEYALHIHLVFTGRISSRYSWYITPSMARRQWVRCIKSVYSGSFKESALENLQKIRKSAAAYLGKYISKGLQASQSGACDKDTPRFSGHWGGISRPLRQRIRRGVVRILTTDTNGGVIDTVLRCLRRGFSELPIAFYKQGFVSTNSAEHVEEQRGIRVGVGCLRKPTLEGGLADLFNSISRMLIAVQDEDLLSSA